MRLIWLVATCASFAFALPSGSRDDMDAGDNEPYYSEFEPGMDLLAEESGGAVPVMVLPPPSVSAEMPSPEEKERSLMLVMPLTSANASKIEDLYTKQPVTQIVDTTTTTVTPAPTQRAGTTLVVTPTPQKKLPPVETITLPPPTIRPDIKDLLASIGLFPESGVPAAAAAPQEPFPFKAAADSFSPEIKELMSQFGVLPLQTNDDYTPTTSKPLLPTVDTGSFANFKRIPDHLHVDQEMNDFLAQFGLVDRKTSSRQLTTPTPDQQTVQTTETDVVKLSTDFKIRPKEPSATEAPMQIPTLHPDSMSGEMKRVLFDLGLAPHLTRDDIQYGDEPTVQLESNEAPGALHLLEERSSANHEFVFNPTDAAPLNGSMEEKLKQILSTFKYLNESGHSPEEVEKQVQEATKLFSKYRKGLLNNGGPDPLALDDVFGAGGEAHNELHKRQNNDSSTSTTTTTTESFSSATSTEEASTDKADGGGPSLADLESSFGGGGDEVADEELPPPKPNGFYFLLDLNTFLNVGEDDKGVHLRLAPRLGNSKNFLPITVP